MGKTKKERDLNWRPPKKEDESDESETEAFIASENLVKELDIFSGQIVNSTTKRRRTISEENKPVFGECEPPRKRMKVNVVSKQTTVTVPLRDVTNVPHRKSTKQQKSFMDLSSPLITKNAIENHPKPAFVFKQSVDEMETSKDEEMKPPSPPRVDPLTPEFKLPTPPIRKNKSDGNQKHFSFFGDILKKFIPNPLEWFQNASDDQQETQKNSQETQIATTVPVLPVIDDALDEVYLYYKRFQIPFTELHLQQQVSSGAFGNVYKATWRGSTVAVKLFKMDCIKTLPMFRKEVALLANLRHSNIILYMGHVTEPGKIGIVMEYAEKGSLYDIIHRKKQKLTYEQVLRAAKQIALGLNYLHLCSPKIIHRDLKTANIVLDNAFSCKLADFGISREATSTMTGYTGTVSYMAPEMVSAQNHYTEKVDVYSYGIILWEMYTGERPFSGLLPIQVAYQVGHGERPPIPNSCPKNFSMLTQMCWQGDSEKRPSIQEVIDFLNSNFVQLMET